MRMHQGRGLKAGSDAEKGTRRTREAMKAQEPREARGTQIESQKEPRGLKVGMRAVAKVLILAIWVAGVVILMESAVGYLLLWILGTERMAEPVWQAVYSAAAYILAFVVIWALMPKLTGQRAMGRIELGLKGLPTWTDIGLGLAGYVAAIMLAAGMVAFFQLFPWFSAEQEQSLIFSPYIEGADRVIAFIILALVAPVAEELIFRGWLYGKARAILGEKLGKRGSIMVAILIVSVLFGILHGQWNVGVTVFAMSVVMCMLREITGTIYAGIIVHMIKNGLAFYLLYVVGLGM